MKCYALVVTPRCDIEHKLAYVTLLPALTAGEFLHDFIEHSEALGAVTLDEFYGRVKIPAKRRKAFTKAFAKLFLNWQRGDDAGRYHFMPSYGEDVPPCFVDFQAAHSYQAELVRKHAGTCAVASPYIEHLLARYASWVGRVGVDGPTPDEINRLIEDIAHFDVSS
jgi:hypothetical protein